MTQAQARTRVRELLDQADTSNTQFDETTIDYFVNEARRIFAVLLSERHLPKLVAGTDSSLSVTAGYASYPSDFLRPHYGIRATIDSVQATRIGLDQQWRVRYLESNDLVKSGSADKYFWEEGAGIKVLPSGASGISYPYIKKPADLSGSDNTDLPPDVEDLTIHYAYEKCMGTRRGDIELAIHLAQQRNLTVRNLNQ